MEHGYKKTAVVYYSMKGVKTKLVPLKQLLFTPVFPEMELKYLA
jgi:hypothetical protein